MYALQDRSLNHALNIQHVNLAFVAVTKEHLYVYLCKHSQTALAVPELLTNTRGWCVQQASILDMHLNIGYAKTSRKKREGKCLVCRHNQI